MHRVIDTAEIWAGGTPVVVQALPLEDHWIEVRFDDGRHGVFDMNPYLEKPAFSPLKDEAFFKQLYIRNGVVCWSDDIDIAAERMWTDSEPVTEHWTYPEDWPTVGDTGPDGSPIVFVTGKGFPVTDKLEDKWGEEADREDFRWEPESPLFIGGVPRDDELKRLAEHGKKESQSHLATENQKSQQDVCRQMIAMRKAAEVDLDEMARRTGYTASQLWKAEDGSSVDGLFDFLADYCTALGKTFTVTIADASDDAADE